MTFSPRFRWTLDDLDVHIGPPSGGQYWCLDVDVCRPSTGQNEQLLWDINTPGNLACREGRPTILDPAPFPERDLLVMAGQGIGDVIQQWRFLAPVARQFRQVTVQCRPELHGLLRQQCSTIQVVTPEQACDYPEQARVSLMRLDALCSDPSAGRAYLKSRSESALPGKQATRRLRVGLNWAANAGGAAHHIKSVPVTLLGQMVRGRPDIDWVSVQWGEDEQRLFQQPWSARVERQGNRLLDVADLAQAIAGLDLLISIDSAPAHIAGALGVPVWCLLSRPCSWRWGLHTAQTPLYRSMRLLRQQEQGDWSSVIDQLGRLLQDMVQPAKRQDDDASAPHSLLSSWGPLASPAGCPVLSLPPVVVPDKAGPFTVQDALRLCREQPGWQAAFVSQPLPLLASLGVRVRSRDYPSLTEIFKTMVACHGGFSWCSPVPDKVHELRA